MRCRFIKIVASDGVLLSKMIYLKTPEMNRTGEYPLAFGDLE